MSCIQVTSYPLIINFKNVNGFKGSPFEPCCALARINEFPSASQKLVSCASTYQRLAPVCLFGGKGKSENGGKDSPWNALEKAMGNLGKSQSIEDVLRQQMAKEEYFDEGGSSGGNPPGNRHGGGGDGDGSSEPSDEGFSGIMDEVLQVMFATLGFVFVYIYIINGEDITRLAKDFIKFVFRGKKSLRLQRLMDDWKKFFQQLTVEEEEHPYWLESAIITTPTWYDSPDKYKRILQSYLASRSDLRSDSRSESRSYRGIDSDSEF